MSNARKEIYNFLTSSGLESTTIEFSVDNYILSIDLDRSFYLDYFAGEDLRPIITAIQDRRLYHIEDKTQSNPYSVNAFTINSLRYSQDRILGTLDYIWSLTYKPDGTRQKVYLYYLPKNSEGFGYQNKDYDYLPVMNSPEWNIFNSMPAGMQARGIVLDPDHPELFDPSTILGAMNVDGALCVARTEGMADNEILIAFDQFRPYMPFLVKNKGRNIIGPSPYGLIEKDTQEFLKFYFRYWKIVNKNKMVSFHRYHNPDDFYGICKDSTNSLLWFLTEYDPPSVLDPRWFK